MMEKLRKDAQNTIEAYQQTLKEAIQIRTELGDQEEAEKYQLELQRYEEKIEKEK